MSNKYYPINIDLKDKKCLVVGAGVVAERKVNSLLKCGAAITVVAPKATALFTKLAKNKKIVFKKRRVVLRDVSGASVVICASGDRNANSLVSSYCRKNNILVNVVDVPSECNFIVPAVVRRGDLVISISTGGVSPALAKKIRQDLEKHFGLKYAEFLRKAKTIRKKAMLEIKNPDIRRKFLKKLVGKIKC